MAEPAGKPSLTPQDMETPLIVALDPHANFMMIALARKSKIGRIWESSFLGLLLPSWRMSLSLSV